MKRDLQKITREAKEVSEILKEHSGTLKSLESGLETKCSADDINKVWLEFQRYASYDDLRDLYNRTVPAVSSFEAKIKLVRDEVAKFEYSILRFDELILDKASKKNVKDF